MKKRPKAKRSSYKPVEVMLGRRVMRHSPASLELGGAVDAKTIVDEMMREQRAKGTDKGDAAAQKDVVTQIVSAYFGLG